MGQSRTIAGTRWLITGASQGIGFALTNQVALAGARVLAVARNVEFLTELAAELAPGGAVVVPVQGDVTSPADRQRFLSAAMQHFGGLDVLVNNAGVGATGHFVEAQPDRLRKIMETNFFAVAEMTRLFLPILRVGEKPAIVNISSIAGKRGIPARGEYSASKFALEGFSEALRAELVKFSIDVLVVAPGLTQTNFSKNMLEQAARQPLDHLRGMTADEVATAIIRAAECGRDMTVLTFKGKLLTLVSRLLPRLADWIAARKVRALFREEIDAREAAQMPSLVENERRTAGTAAE